jgi:hypothetical protein
MHTVNISIFPPTARATCHWHVTDTAVPSLWCVYCLLLAVFLANDANILPDNTWGRGEQYTSYGENCRYQHCDEDGVTNVVARNVRARQTAPCKHFMRTGHCTVGDACNLYVTIPPALSVAKLFALAFTTSA